MLNCRLVVDVGSDFDSLNFAPFRLPYLCMYSVFDKFETNRVDLRCRERTVSSK